MAPLATRLYKLTNNFRLEQNEISGVVFLFKLFLFINERVLASDVSACTQIKYPNMDTFKVCLRMAKTCKRRKNYPFILGCEKVQKGLKKNTIHNKLAEEDQTQIFL